MMVRYSFHMALVDDGTVQFAFKKSVTDEFAGLTFHVFSGTTYAYHR